MPRYSEERRQAVVTKLLPPHNLSPQVIAEQEGISLGTVYTWRKQARAEGRCLPDALGKGADGWSSKDKFNAVLETASMNAQETAEYCRRRGIYPEQLWRGSLHDLGDGEIVLASHLSERGLALENVHDHGSLALGGPA